MQREKPEEKHPGVQGMDAAGLTERCSFGYVLKDGQVWGGSEISFSGLRRWE